MTSFICREWETAKGVGRRSSAGGQRDKTCVFCVVFWLACWCSDDEWKKKAEIIYVIIRFKVGNELELTSKYFHAVFIKSDQVRLVYHGNELYMEIQFSMKYVYAEWQIWHSILTELA